MLNDKKRLVEVCSECGDACCCHGEHMCWESKNAGTIKKTVEELDRANSEHKEHYSKETMVRIYGEEAPHGYETEQPTTEG